MREITIEYDCVIIGAGLSGMCAAITAARQGMKTALIQDRSIPGGNASKEIRVPLVGARWTNFLYARETGLIEEILLNNLYHNSSWNFEGWNLQMVSALKQEPNLDVFYNTPVTEIAMGKNRLLSVSGWTIGSELKRTFIAPYFCDSTGDGTIAVMAGASFMWGEDAKSEYHEKNAPEIAEKRVMGCSIHFHTIDCGKPAPFVKPEWVTIALEKEDFGVYRPVEREFIREKGGFWWIEWGGEEDVIHGIEKITDKLEQIVLSIWDFLKNKSDIKDSITHYELDWIGSVTSKRESRRFHGDHVLTQTEIDNQYPFEDAVAYGGWGFDDHPKGGFYGEIPSYHWAIKGPYNIPLRSLYTKDVENLFLAGRNISATHIALANTRVMLTCAQLGEAVGMAAALCFKGGLTPRQLSRKEHVSSLQQALLKIDHHLHAIPFDDDQMLIPKSISTSSDLLLGDMTQGMYPIGKAAARLWQFPLETEYLKTVLIPCDAAEETTVTATLFLGASNHSTYPEKELAQMDVKIKPGKRMELMLPWDIKLPRKGWYFIEIKENPLITFYGIPSPPVGIAGYTPKLFDPIRPNDYFTWESVSGNYLEVEKDDSYTPEALKEPVKEIHIAESAYAFSLEPPQNIYTGENLINSYNRPYDLPYLWISEPLKEGEVPWVELTFEKPVSYKEINILFDSMLSFHFSQSYVGYDTNVIPTLVKDYAIYAKNGEEYQEIARIEGNHQRQNRFLLEGKTTSFRFEFYSTNGIERIQVYSIQVF